VLEATKQVDNISFILEIALADICSLPAESGRRLSSPTPALDSLFYCKGTT